MFLKHVIESYYKDFYLKTKRCSFERSIHQRILEK